MSRTIARRAGLITGAIIAGNAALRGYVWAIIGAGIVAGIWFTARQFTGQEGESEQWRESE